MNETADRVDARLLLALIREPRATVLRLSQLVGIARNTVQARLARFDQRSMLTSFENRIDPAALGYPLTSIVMATVTQRMLAEVSSALAEIPEVLEVLGLSGAGDLLVRVVARDADDLYRIAGRILATNGVERTQTSLVMRTLITYRIAPLLDRLAGSDS